jgi:cytoskeletal protein RodZ
MNESDSSTTPPPAAPAPTKAEIIKNISQTLVSRRKERNLSLEKVAQVIKIRLPYLQSIERGAWDELPGEVYVRGFIVRYAGFLGLDPVALMAPYLNLVAPAVEPKPASNTQLSADASRLQFLWIGLIGIFIVVFIKLIQKERTAPLKPIVSTVSAPAVAVSTVTAVNATEIPSAALPQHTLEVYSPYPLWLRVNTANKEFQGFIPQAASWTWRGEGTMTVRFGHTKQVTLSFDGKQIALSEDQRILTLPQ